MSQCLVPIFESVQASFDVVDVLRALKASILEPAIHSFSPFILSGMCESGCDFYALCYSSVYSYGCFGKERVRMEERE